MVEEPNFDVEAAIKNEMYKKMAHELMNHFSDDITLRKEYNYEEFELALMVIRRG